MTEMESKTLLKPYLDRDVGELLDIGFTVSGQLLLAYSQRHSDQFEALQSEWDNLYGAIRWADQNGDLNFVLALAQALNAFVTKRITPSVGVKFLDSGIRAARKIGEPHQLGALLNALAFLYCREGTFGEATALYLEAYLRMQGVTSETILEPFGSGDKSILRFVHSTINTLATHSVSPQVIAKSLSPIEGLIQLSRTRCDWNDASKLYLLLAYLHRELGNNLEQAIALREIAVFLLHRNVGYGGIITHPRRDMAGTYIDDQYNNLFVYRIVDPVSWWSHHSSALDIIRAVLSKGEEYYKCAETLLSTVIRESRLSGNRIKLAAAIREMGVLACFRDGKYRLSQVPIRVDAKQPTVVTLSLDGLDLWFAADPTGSPGIWRLLESQRSRASSPLASVGDKQQKEFFDAASCFKEAVDIYYSLGQGQELAESLDLYAQILAERGNYSEAETAMIRAISAYESLGDKAAQARALRRLAQLKASQWEYNEAARHLSGASRLFDELNDQIGLLYCFRLLGDVTLASDDLNSASQYYALAEHHAYEVGSSDFVSERPRYLLSDVLRSRATIAQRCGQPEAATQLLQESLTISQGLLFDYWGVAESSRALGEIALGCGQYAEAARLVSEACRAYFEGNHNLPGLRMLTMLRDVGRTAAGIGDLHALQQCGEVMFSIAGGPHNLRLIQEAKRLYETIF